MKSNVIDQPAEAGKDTIGMKAYVEALTLFIKEAQAPLTIALQGEWGSGKTSLMNALKAKLAATNEQGEPVAEAPYLGVWINTWQYALMANPEETIQSILLGIIGQISPIGTSNAEERGTLLRKVARVGKGVVSDIFKKYSGVDVEKNMKEWNTDMAVPSKSGVEDLKEELADIVAKALANTGKRGYLFFIDDLDRIDPPVAVQILELLKNIFDLDRCIFVLAIDYGVVVKGLKPKFGAMTAENEREFRSFFDKIIQLPFAMPVNSYKIDRFLMESLDDIGFLAPTEKDDDTLCEALTYYALQSVGTNPRSLKRLINYLSLIRLIIERTPAQDDDADFKEWKDVLFALVCIQVQYPKIYEALQAEPDFTAWKEQFEQKWSLPSLEAGEKERLGKLEEFDEPWEQILFRFCRRDPFLEARSLNISKVLNRIKARIVEADQPVGDTVDWLLRLSAVTSIKSEPEKSVGIEDFSQSDFLKALRGQTFGLKDVWTEEGKHGWQACLSDRAYLSSWQGAVKKNLHCELWLDRKTYNDEQEDGFLTEPTFQIFHDGKSFQLKVFGEFWGNWPNDKFLGLDFNAEDIQGDLARTLDGVRNAWSAFGVTGNCGCNPGTEVGNGDIWWNATIPFSSHDELVGEEFSEILRGGIVKLAEAFATLLPRRIRNNN